MTSLPTSKSLLNHLKLHHQNSRIRLKRKHPIAYSLLHQKDLLPGQLRLFAAKLLSSATMAGTVLSHTGGLFALLPAHLAHAVPHHQPPPVHIDHQAALIHALEPLLGSKPGQLHHHEIDNLNTHLQAAFGITAAAELDGNRLNHDFGWIGYEQHLYRYPGDNLSQHQTELQAGIAPGLGAWGYFANSQSALTETDIQREKYYVAVQTLYLEEWNTDHHHLKDWYKYRKVIVINPQNGQMIIANIADAGPAKWTGKQFGGSPEVMKHLNLHAGPRKGQVILLFVDDPDDQVPLGPLHYEQVPTVDTSHT